MSKLTPSPMWTPLDIDGVCKLYDETKTSVSVRQGNQVAAVRALVAALNHLLATTTVIHMQQGLRIENALRSSEDPLYEWRYYDGVTNGRTDRYRLVATHRLTGEAGAATAQRDGDGTVITPPYHGEVATGTFPADSFFTECTPRNRGAASGLTTEGLTTNNGFTVLDICVHSAPLPALEVSVHEYCQPAPAAGTYVVANILAAVRHWFFRLRSSALPVLFSMHLQLDSDYPLAQTSTSPQAIVVTSTDYVNILDQSYSERTATSPGFLYDCYKCGTGTSDKVPIAVSVHAATDGIIAPDYALFAITGPDHTINNSTTVPILAATPTWYDLSSYIYGNPTVTITDTSTERNKVDAFARIVSADPGTLFIYAVRGRMAWAT